jgi:cytochrome c oxidase cbb3-type subunit 4
MRILNQFIESIDGIEVFPIISLFIFISIFGLTTFWALSLKKGDVEKMKEVPFDDNEI